MKPIKSENSENFKNTPNPISKWNLGSLPFAFQQHDQPSVHQRRCTSNSNRLDMQMEDIEKPSIVKTLRLGVAKSDQVPLSACSSLAQSFVLLLVLRLQLSVLAVFQAHCRPAPVQIQLNWVMKQKLWRPKRSEKHWKAASTSSRAISGKGGSSSSASSNTGTFGTKPFLRLTIRLNCTRIFENRLSTIQTPRLSQPLLSQWCYLLKIVCRQAPILSLRGRMVKSTWEYLRSFRQRTRVNDFIPLCIDHMIQICLHSLIRKLGSAMEAWWSYSKKSACCRSHAAWLNECNECLVLQGDADPSWTPATSCFKMHASKTENLHVLAPSFSYLA